ncbi:MAG TPA: TIGR04222 domain-containing membrane protein [Planktothrix sp.]|jgi:uncharacterized protein (TIGR04222 family)
MDIYDLSGPAFLSFVLTVMFIALGAALALRFKCQLSFTQTVNKDELNVYDTAYLSGGASAALNAAVTSLTHRGAIELLSSADAIAVHPIQEELHPLEQYLVDRLNGQTAAEAARTCKQIDVAALLHEKLEKLGLVASRNTTAMCRAVSTLLILTPLLLVGLAKIAIGLSRHKPVGFLVAICLFFAFITWLFYSIDVVRTFAGEQLLWDNNTTRRCAHRRRRVRRSRALNWPLRSHFSAEASWLRFRRLPPAAR